jgi:hypothetical protein
MDGIVDDDEDDEEDEDEDKEEDLKFVSETSTV